MPQLERIVFERIGLFGRDGRIELRIDGGIIDQDVDSAETLANAGDHRLDVGLASYVDGPIERFAARFGNRGRHGVGGLARVCIGNDHLGAGFQQGSRVLTAQHSGAAGQNRHATVQRKHFGDRLSQRRPPSAHRLGSQRHVQHGDALLERNVARSTMLDRGQKMPHFGDEHRVALKALGHALDLHSTVNGLPRKRAGMIVPRGPAAVAPHHEPVHGRFLHVIEVHLADDAAG